MTATNRALLLLAVFAVAALFVPGWVAVAGFALVLVAIAVDLWMIRRAPRVERSEPGLLWRGVPTTIRVETQTSISHQARQPTGPSLIVTPAESVGSLEAELVALRRGHHELPPVSVTLSGPLGLGRWRHDVGEDLAVSVYPDMPAAYNLAEEVRHGRFIDEGRRSRGPVGLGTEFESIRDYQPDDDIRQVNWKATARVGRPMSNVWRVEQDREVICLLDAGRLMAAPLGDLTRLDAAVDVVAAMAAVADEIGDRIGVVVFSDHIMRHVKPARDNGREAIHALYDVQPSPADSSYELAFRLVAGAKRSFLLILTDLLDEGAAAPLLDAMGLLARHHSVTVAAVRDEDVYGAATEFPTTRTDVFEMSSALDVLATRRRLVVRIERFGAQVVESSVGSFSRACVAAYMRSRRSARI